MSKVIVITGAGSGLGRAMAESFAADGDTVILLGRTFSKVESVAAGIGERAHAIKCDIAVPEEVRAAFAEIKARHPRIDVLINNAGIFIPSPVVDASDDLIFQTININLSGAIFCSREAIKLMGPGGHIINISSESIDMPFAHMSLYQASKAGLERFTLSLHRELEDQGIRATYVRAGQMMGEYAQGIAGADPQVMMNFMTSCLARGLNLMQRPSTDFISVPKLIRTLIDLPADLHVVSLAYHARATEY
jgi:meso-butanediol dehydrogenase/(S,S)-butanediol dehydrogenase/diacetyl reductase